MPIYTYKAIDKKGKDLKGKVTSDTLIIAKQKIKAMGIMLINIKEEKSKKSSGSTLTFGAKVKITELALMTRQLATLIKARIQIVEALNALMDQVESDLLKVVLSEVKQDVNEGLSLAKSLSKHPKVFNNVFVNMVEAGEASGTLDIVLLRLADFTEAQVKLKNKISSAMIYPFIMGIFGFGMMNVIFIFVIPKIAKIFTSRKMDLPFMTELCIAVSNYMVSYWWTIIIGVLAGTWAFKKYIRSKKGERVWHKVLLIFPILGPIVQMINVSRFCSTLATLLNSGVPILAAMNIVKNLIPNVLLKDAVEASRISISEGSSMTEPLVQSGHFPIMVTHMMALGEKSGELEPMLKIVAENYEDQVDTKIGGLTSILEPIMMVIMGIAVGIIVMAVVVPLMSLNSVK
jgi:general secretion pathway protein F